jgi:hypothetical protein
MPQVHLLETRSLAKSLVFKKLYPIDDQVLLLVNAHLIIESLLYKYIIESVCFPSALENARLTFHQIKCLANSLRKRHEEERWFWNTLKELNSIRNSLAHNINVDDLSGRIRKIIETSQEKITIHWPDANQYEREKKALNYFLIVLCGVAFNLTNESYKI